MLTPKRDKSARYGGTDTWELVYDCNYFRVCAERLLSLPPPPPTPFDRERDMLVTIKACGTPATQLFVIAPSAIAEGARRV